MIKRRPKPNAYKLVHLMALAFIIMTATFAGLIFLPFPNFFFENTLYFFVIVPYVLITLPFESAMQDPHAQPLLQGIIVGWYVFVIYSFFFAIVTAICSKHKIILIGYAGLYVTLSFVFDKLFGHLF